MDKQFRINGEIRAPNVSLVMPDGESIPEVTLGEALGKAETLGLDLIEVNPSSNGRLPVCKLENYRKMVYKMEKSAKQPHPKRLKEMHYGYNTASHDLDTKNRKVTEFLSKKHRVRMVMDLRGREKAFRDQAIEKFNRDLGVFDDKSTHDVPKVTPNEISVILIPVD